MPHNFIIGDTARIPVEITDLAVQALADPGGLVLMIRKPDQTLIELSYGTDAGLVRTATGLYYTDVELDQSGRWKWRWEATSPHSGVVENRLDVRASYVL